MSEPAASLSHETVPCIEPARPLDLPAGLSPASGKCWRLRDADARTALAIAQDTGLDIVVARAIAARGVALGKARQYLEPSLREALPDPHVLADMERLADRLADAVMAGEGIGVFGDYDVDGTTAAALLHQYFGRVGVEINVYLPDRFAEGYGPSAEAFLSLRDKGADVVITVDCGASAHGPIEKAAGAGLDILVIDHHLMSGPPPEGARAVVNPNRDDDGSGLEDLSAAGLAFMAVVAINRALRARGFFQGARVEPNLLSLLDLAALGLVCDVMKMRGLTRVMVAQGLKVMAARAGNPGLAALGVCAGVSTAPSTYDLGFLLGPRINAAGRIGHARLALELMTTNDEATRSALAARLHALNAERQEIEAAVQTAALAAIERDKLDGDAVIVVAGAGWHAGVIGVVSGRLKERFNKPVIVIALDGDSGKGSGRSLEGVDLGAAVSKAYADDLLLAGGGHAMAAGLTIAAESVSAFRARLNETLGAAVAQARADAALLIDGVVSQRAVSRAMADAIGRAGPFGPGNAEPVFVLCNLLVESAKTVGKGHLACSLRAENGERVRAIAFRAVGEPLGDVLRLNERVHVAGKIRADAWRGGEAAQLQIVDAALASPPS